jgi:hypothetical protein
MKNHINSKRVQSGMTMYGVMFLLVVVGFVATAAIKLGPVYMDNRVVVSALEEMHNDYASANMQDVTDNEILGKVQKYFQVNMVSDEIEKAAKVTRAKDQVILSFNYEIRKPFMGNVDVVLVFNNEIDLAH